MTRRHFERKKKEEEVGLIQKEEEEVEAGSVDIIVCPSSGL